MARYFRHHRNLDRAAMPCASSIGRQHGFQDAPPRRFAEPTCLRVSSKQDLLSRRRGTSFGADRGFAGVLPDRSSIHDSNRRSASYREIDNFVEDKAVVARTPKAAWQPGRIAQANLLGGALTWLALGVLAGRRLCVYATVARPPNTRSGCAVSGLMAPQRRSPWCSSISTDRFRILPIREIRTVLVDMPRHARLRASWNQIRRARSPKLARGKSIFCKMQSGDGSGLIGIHRISRCGCLRQRWLEGFRRRSTRT